MWRYGIWKLITTHETTHDEIAQAVLASVKVRNLKANHNSLYGDFPQGEAVLASVKVRNLKANHNAQARHYIDQEAVLASVKVRNLKANHNAKGLVAVG